MGGHFKPFTGVQNGNRREVTRKWLRDVNRDLPSPRLQRRQGIGYPLNRDRVIPKALVCGAALRYPQKTRRYLETVSFGVSEATIFSKQGSPRRASQNGISFNSP